MEYIEDFNGDPSELDRCDASDCIDKVENRFELVLLLSKISKLFNDGSIVLNSKKTKKDFVSAMISLSNGDIDIEKIRELYRGDFVKKTLDQELLSDNRLDDSDNEELDVLNYISGSIETDINFMDIPEANSDTDLSSNDGFYLSDNDTEDVSSS